MILIGQYDSAFVRRVGIALTVYELPYQHRPWSVFGDRERLMEINPLGGVPVLVLDDGTAIPDSSAILDHLDRMVPPERRMWPDDWSAARRLLALSTGLVDRFVSLYYARNLGQSPQLEDRRAAQVTATLAVLNKARAAAPGAWLFGDRMTHADIALACAIRHLRESLPDLFDPAATPALQRHAIRAETLKVFTQISQPFVGPGA